MKIPHLALATMLLVDLPPAAVAVSNPPSIARWKTIETMRYSWRHGAPAYTFVVEENLDPPKTDSDPRTPRLRIVSPNGGDLIVAVEGGLVKSSDGLGSKAIASDNLLKSDFVYLSPKLKGSHGEPALIVFGWAFASDPGSIRVVALDANATPRLIFSHDTFDLDAIADLDGDGAAELIGHRSLSQGFGKCFQTCDPFAVYRFENGPLPKATYSLTLSKAYNLKHYFGWAGPSAREDLAVVMCPEARGRIMNSKLAEAQFGR